MYEYMVLMDAVARYVCALSANFNDSRITASDASGPIIEGNIHAYRQLSGIDWSSNFEGAIRWNRIGRRLLRLRRTVISSLRLRSIEGEPLVLHETASNYMGEVKRSVYTGNLRLSWTESYYLFGIALIPFISSAEKSSTLTVDSLSLLFRVDDSNSLLDCYDPSDPADNNGLICVHLNGTLDRPMDGAVTIKCKSDRPVRYDDPVQFMTRYAEFIVF